ncbi:MAG: pyridoxamine 5'-phosphate oxidase family protein [Pseudomonadales bacterium]|nr:pyridoxamine 5'-phosphate oxidase family protein [Pseudomonadales bacterium]
MNTETASPFHQGEKKIQQRLGVRQSMEQFGRKVIRDHMPQQHQDFYAQLAYLFIGHVDAQGWPWASILCSPDEDLKGFMRATNNKSLLINTQPLPGDPLKENLQHGHKVALLGIDLASRRRNRLAARVNHIEQNAFSLNIDQAFGNCPQYIQSRQVKFAARQQQPTRQAFTQLDSQAIALIEQADTFFVSSYIGNPNKQTVEETDKTHGVDISHRGGLPGFIKIENDVLSIPDFPGNNHFNTLGNFIENPKAGLLFADFKRGHLLMLTGSVTVHWDHAEQQHFDSAERFWSFQLHQGLWLYDSLPIQWQPEELSANTFSANTFSANTMLTGTWEKARQNKTMADARDAWQTVEVIDSVKESEVVRSLHLKPLAGGIHRFKAGQFLTLSAEIDQSKSLRTYTVSNSTHDEFYRISVKRDGVFSTYLHQLKSGDQLKVKAPRGEFFIEPAKTEPVVLMAAGIGITPMISMIRQLLLEAIRTRHLRPILLLATARNAKQRAFYQELKALIKTTGKGANGMLRVIWGLTQPENNLAQGSDYDFKGRLNSEILNQFLAEEEVTAQTGEFYLCGPADFMQSSYELLRGIGVPDPSINCESFGISALKRDTVPTGPTELNTTPAQASIAESAIVTVSDHDGNQLLEQQWQPADGTLLELFENHGLSPQYACRSGQCGSCQATLVAGEVAYEVKTTAIEKDSALLCCAKPKAAADEKMPVINIQLPA